MGTEKSNFVKCFGLNIFPQLHIRCSTEKSLKEICVSVKCIRGYRIQDVRKLMEHVF